MNLNFSKFKLALFKSCLWMGIWVVGATLAVTGQVYAVSERVSLQKEIILSEADLAFVQQLEPIKIAAYPNAPPYVSYRPESNTFYGVAIDVFKFVAAQIGLPYEYIQPGSTLAEDFERVRTGELDLLLPISENEERSKFAYFTHNYAYDYYAVIVPKSENLHMISALGLQNKRVGYIASGSIYYYLKEGLNIENLVPMVSRGELFGALRKGEINAAVYVKRAFEYEQVKNNLYDLEAVYVLQNFPRPYGFMFRKTDEYQKLVEIFNRFIPFLNISASMAYHGVVEKEEVHANQQIRFLIYLLTGLLIFSAVLWVAMVKISTAKEQAIKRELENNLSAIMADKKQLEEQNQTLIHLSLLDSLTGLANRRAFDEMYQREFKNAERKQQPISLLLLDLDHFKYVNDTFGHQEGDRYLRKVGQEINKQLVRPTDLACRYGGEEFACILPDTTFANALFLAEKIRLAVQNLKLPNPGSKGDLTISIGVASTEGNGKSKEQLIQFADSYLYQAKRFGRNQVFGRLYEYSDGQTDLQAALKMRAGA